MQGNIEFEEGEACCYKDDEDNIDLDSLSYIFVVHSFLEHSYWVCIRGSLTVQNVVCEIVSANLDERIQRVLGHFQKDFEGGVSAEHLGPKFGDYGSFLPTCERSPPLRSHPKTPQRHFTSPKSPNNLHTEAAFLNSKAPLNKPPSMKLGTASHNAPPFHNLRAPSVGGSTKKDTGISSNAEMEKCTLKDNHVNKSEKFTDQRTLKLRIKVKSDILAKRNAAIYSGLGLDDSPSSSMGNSPEESGVMPPVSQETPEESPMDIVQVMTSCTIPGGMLISPLHNSLFCLIRKEKVLGDSRPTSSLNGHQEHCSISTDESDSFVGDGHLLKKRKVRMVCQSEKQYMNGICSENDMILHKKKRLENRTPDCKDLLSNDLKCTPLSSSICDAGETAEVTGKAFEVSKEVVNKDGVECRTGSLEAVKEDSLESISGRDFDKTEKQNTGNSFSKKVFEHKPEFCQKNNSTDPKNHGKYNAFMISKKDERDTVKYNLDQDTQKHETDQKGKAKFEGKKKSKGDPSPGKAMTASGKDSIGYTNNAMVTDKNSAGVGVTGKHKLLKIKSLKDNKVRDSLKEKNSERKVDGIDRASGPPVNKAKINVNLDNIEGKSAYRVKVKGRASDNKIVNQLLAGPCAKDAPGAFPIAENNPIPEMVPPPAPQLIEEDWVCCDSCQKWRLLPIGLKPEQLPEKWLCSMLYWLPGMNRCNISEEETTKALYALYQMPISEGQNNMQIHPIGPETGLSSADALQFGLNHKKSSSDVMSDRGKKKHGIKEKKKLGISSDMHQLSNTAKINAQESGKNRSSVDVNQQPTDSNHMKKSNSKHLNRLNNSIEEKNIPKEKEKQISGGGRNHVKLKRKMEADQYISGTPKKSMTEDVCYADKELNPDMDFEKVGLSSSYGLPTKGSVKNMRECDEYCLSEDLQNRSVVPIKKGNQTPFSSDDGSLDIMNSSKSGSIKKRKLNDWLDNEKHNTLSVVGDIQYGEESSVSGFRKEKKCRVLNTEAKSVTQGDDKLSRKGGMKQVFLSDSRDQTAVGIEVKSVDKAQQPRKLRKNVASYEALDYFDPLGKDLDSGQLPLAANSSSSKVSGSHKARNNLEDVRGSPVESVTSSPLRTSNLDKRILAAGNMTEKDDSRKGGLSSMSYRKSLDNREGKLSVTMKGKVLSDLPAQHGNCGNGSHHEEKMKKNNQENALSWQKSGKVTSLRVKEKDRRSGSDISRDKMKVSTSENSISKNGMNYELAVNPSYHASDTETRNDAKNSSPESRHKNVDTLNKKNSLRHWSSESGKPTVVKQKDFENSVLKADAPYSISRKIISQQNLIHKFEEENKANQVGTESRDGKAKVLLSSEDKAKRETSYVGSRTAPESQKEDMSNGQPVHARNSTDVSCKVGVNRRSGHFAPDEQLKESSPVTTNSSETAFSILEEATKLKDSADRYKNSGFEFESNETYFKAALKFLQGVSLLENCQSESSKHGEMDQIQLYATTAKLFESCAHNYDKRREMATAALAYKCMEVAYMRLVYCKHSSINRDRHELQSTLQMVSQGESPSSSASDIDNFNNMAAVDKSTLPRSTNTHVANNQAISARNHPTLVRLLDFTQDMNFAMDASRKCQSTFMAANLIMEEAQNSDCITSIRKVIDFSFQDVDELVHLVLIATKAIARAGLGGARD
ncbi:Zinc finger, CW-type [Sesbania bispinosa]|nr:Zinc finger, CW-type [Sesbania bispinosa]